MQLCRVVALLAVLVVASATPQLIKKPIVLLSRSDAVDEHGQYFLTFETDEHYKATEQGALKPGPEGNVLVKMGSYSYVAPDGTLINTKYTADERGFMAEGDHLPIPVVPIH